MKPKFFFVTTIPRSLVFFEGQYDLLKEKFDITAISSQQEELENTGARHQIKVHYIPMKRDISLLIDLLGLFHFIWYFRKQRPQIVHGNTPKGSLLSMIAAWLTGVPVRIYMCHGLRYQGCNGFKRMLLILTEKITCRCATKVMCVSLGVAQVLKDKHITNKEPVVVWNGSVKGIDVVKFDPNHDYDKEAIRKQYGIVKNNFVLTFVGRIVKDKGVEELVSAFLILIKKYPKMRLLLIGRFEEEGNPISPAIKKIIDSNDAIIAPGPQKNIPEILSITDVFVFPSYREGFGLSLMEAGAMGVPSVSTNIIGCNEIVIDGETGVLIPSHSSSAIVNAIEKLYTDPCLVESMKEKCRASIVNRYESKKLIEKYMEFYDSLNVELV